MHVDQKVVRECYVTSLKVELTKRDSSRTSKGRSQEQISTQERRTSRTELRPARREHTVALVDLDPWINELTLERGKDIRSVPLQDEKDTTNFRTYLTLVDGKTIHQTLKKNADLFAWAASDMLRVSLEVIIEAFCVKGGTPDCSKKVEARGEEAYNCKGRGGEALGDQLYSRNPSHCVVSQCSDGKESEQQVANVY